MHFSQQMTSYHEVYGYGIFWQHSCVRLVQGLNNYLLLATRIVLQMLLHIYSKFKDQCRIMAEICFVLQYVFSVHVLLMNKISFVFHFDKVCISVI